MRLGIREGVDPSAQCAERTLLFPALDPSSSSPAPPQPHLLGPLILLESFKAATSRLQERPLTSAIFVNLFLLLRDSYLNFAMAQTQPRERTGGLGL